MASHLAAPSSSELLTRGSISEPSSSVSNWSPLYWTGLYFLSIFEIHDFSPQEKPWQKALSHGEKKPSPESEEPSYQLSLCLDLGHVLA